MTKRGRMATREVIKQVRLSKLELNLLSEVLSASGGISYAEWIRNKIEDDILKIVKPVEIKPKEELNSQ